MRWFILFLGILVADCGCSSKPPPSSALEKEEAYKKMIELLVHQQERRANESLKRVKEATEYIDRLEAELAECRKGKK